MAKRCFLGIEGILYLTFLYLDLKGGSGRASSLLKYTGVIFCFFYSFRQGNGCWIQIGLFFTVISDYFLLFTERWLTGVLTFLVVQLCYSAWRDSRLRCLAEKKDVRLILRLVTAMIAAGGIVFALNLAKMETDLLLYVTAVYFLLLVGNLVGSLLLCKHLRKQREFYSYSHEWMFTVGMFLFLLCDIQVGVFNAAAYFPWVKSLKLLQDIVSVGMWACYLPAKVCISLAA